MTSRLALVPALLVVLVGCASAPPPAPMVAKAPPQAEAIDAPSSLGYESTVGGLPEEDMNRAFAAFGKEVERCVSAGSTRLEALGGHVKIALKVDRSGVAKDVWVSESALGDLDTGKCLVDAARARSWPHAVGGDGLASTSFDATPAKDRQAVDAKRLPGPINQVRMSSMRCRRGVEGAFVVTAYVRADGRVESAGLAMSSADADQAADCIVGVVKGTRFGIPGRSAKVTFSL